MSLPPKVPTGALRTGTSAVNSRRGDFCAP